MYNLSPAKMSYYSSGFRSQLPGHCKRSEASRNSMDLYKKSTSTLKKFVKTVSDSNYVENIHMNIHGIEVGNSE